MNTGIMEATRLTREGKLAEATALIQRTLTQLPQRLDNIHAVAIFREIFLT